MSTETQEPPKYEWLIVAPDYADVLEKRMAVRQYVYLSEPFKQANSYLEKGSLRRFAAGSKIWILADGW